MTDMKFAVVPHSSRNKDNIMGLTQPVFPQVDKLGRTMDRNEFEAVTNRDDENITSYEGASLMQQTQRSRKPF